MTNQSECGIITITKDKGEKMVRKMENVPNQELIMTVGLPGSGKTTWARKKMAQNKGRIKRINKDDMRAMLDSSEWSRGNEKFILMVRDNLIKSALGKGYSVIVDDTNLAPKHQRVLEEIAREKNVDFVVKDLTNVPVTTCIQRDLGRPNSVGSKVIRGMYNQFLLNKNESVEYDSKLPDAIICDVDGTLAQHHRSPYDYDKLDTDTLIRPVKEALDRLVNIEDTVIILSGRPDSHRDMTEEWLMSNGVQYDMLLMREAGDNREDSVIKSEIYYENISGKYNVLWVLDDRNRVVDMWRSLGLTCLQVADGDF